MNDPAQIQLPSDEQWHAVGNAWDVYREQLPIVELKNFILEPSISYPRAAAIAEIAVQKHRQGEMLPADQVEPVYLRDKVTG